MVKMTCFHRFLRTIDGVLIDKIIRKSMVKMLNLDKLTLYLGHF